jgi:TusA-related sulfurtransferase
MIKADVTVDARGLSCPMPVVRTKKAIDTLQPGQVLELLATDKGSMKDVQAWAASTGHEVLETVEQDGVFTFYIRRK